MIIAETFYRGLKIIIEKEQVPHSDKPLFIVNCKDVPSISTGNKFTVEIHGDGELHSTLGEMKREIDCQLNLCERKISIYQH